MDVKESTVAEREDTAAMMSREGGRDRPVPDPSGTATGGVGVAWTLAISVAVAHITSVFRLFAP